MNTETKEMKELVEASSGCWHEMEKSRYTYNHPETGNPWHDAWCSCGKYIGYEVLIGKHSKYGCSINPSPTDLNALFEIAETLGVTHMDIYELGGSPYCAVFIEGRQSVHKTACTLADALRKALHQSIKK